MRFSTMKLLASLFLVVTEINAEAWGPCKIGARNAAQCQQLCDIAHYCEAWSFKKSAKLGFVVSW